MDETAASAYLAERGVTAAPRTLANWRWAGKGPRFYRAGRFVRYSPEHLDSFASEFVGEPLSSTTANPTRQAEAA
jgi:hypothetical protein